MLISLATTLLSTPPDKAHITFKLPTCFLTALINFGKNSSALFAPNLEIKVSLPASLSGFKILESFISSSGLSDGPHFNPVSYTHLTLPTKA